MINGERHDKAERVQKSDEANLSTLWEAKIETLHRIWFVQFWAFD